MKCPSTYLFQNPCDTIDEVVFSNIISIIISCLPEALNSATSVIYNLVVTKKGSKVDDLTKVQLSLTNCPAGGS